MTRASGIKATDFIDRTARWFEKETGLMARVEYTAIVSSKNEWCLWHLLAYHTPNCVLIDEIFTSFTALRTWMKREIRRRGILFRRY